MLVLSRKEGEEIVINGNILVRIVRICGNVVTLGVTAPKDVSIARVQNGVPVMPRGGRIGPVGQFRKTNYLTGEPLETPLDGSTPAKTSDV